MQVRKSVGVLAAVGIMAGGTALSVAPGLSAVTATSRVGKSIQQQATSRVGKAQQSVVWATSRVGKVRS